MYFPYPYLSHICQWWLLYWNLSKLAIKGNSFWPDFYKEASKIIYLLTSDPSRSNREELSFLTFYKDGVHTIHKLPKFVRLSFSHTQAKDCRRGVFYLYKVLQWVDWSELYLYEGLQWVDWGELYLYEVLIWVDWSELYLYEVLI